MSSAQEDQYLYLSNFGHEVLKKPARPARSHSWQGEGQARLSVARPS